MKSHLTIDKIQISLKTKPNPKIEYRNWNVFDICYRFVVLKTLSFQSPAETIRPFLQVLYQDIFPLVRDIWLSILQ